MYQVNDPFVGSSREQADGSSPGAPEAAAAAGASRMLLAGGGALVPSDSGSGSGKGALREIAVLSSIRDGAAGSDASGTGTGAAHRKLFCGDTLRSFVRRLAFSPDASLLLCPAAELRGGAAQVPGRSTDSAGASESKAGEGDSPPSTDPAPALPLPESHRYGVAVYGRGTILGSASSGSSAAATGQSTTDTGGEGSASESAAQSNGPEPSVLLPVGSASPAIAVRCCPALMRGATEGSASAMGVG